MKRYIFISLMFFTAIIANGQYDYFDIIEGEVGDNVADRTSAVELTENGYVIWGLHSIVGTSQVFLYEYNLEGIRVDSVSYPSQNEFVYIGENNSFHFDADLSSYIYSAGVVESDGTHKGYLMKFTTSYDTLLTSRYSLYSHTYIRSFGVFNDGYILLVDYSPNDDFVGSLMIKTNFDGEVEWQQVLRPYEIGANYSNRDIERAADKYFITGLAIDNGDLYGLLSITDLEGNLLEEIEYYDQTYEEWSPLGVTQLTNGELMVIQSLGYEEYDDPLNQGFYWMNIRLAKIDPETGEEYWNQTYLENNELIFGRWVDIEPTEDGGLIILGIAYSDEVNFYNFLYKIDAEGNEEWFKTYWVEEGGFAVNWLRDVEVAHDGGYIMAGTIENSSVDNFTRAWVLKVDACGDEQWQDCQPLSTSNKLETPPLQFYPNPSSGVVSMHAIDPLTSYILYDLSGSILEQKSIQPSHILNLDFSKYSGIFIIQVQSASGNFAVQKLVIQ